MLLEPKSLKHVTEVAEAFLTIKAKPTEPVSELIDILARNRFEFLASTVSLSCLIWLLSLCILYGSSSLASLEIFLLMYHSLHLGATPSANKRSARMK